MEKHPPHPTQLPLWPDGVIFGVKSAGISRQSALDQAIKACHSQGCLPEDVHVAVLRIYENTP